MNTEKAVQLEAALDRLPRVDLVSVRPTPLEALPRLSAHLGGPPLYIKRDDLTGLAMGGNKTRMFEYSLADAQAKGAQVIVAGAAVQSNYCRQLAAACARLGLELQLILRPVRDIDEQEIQGNQLLQRLCGAQVTILPTRDHPSQQAALKARVDELTAQGRKVYWPRRADTVDLDALAYAAAALELAHQCRQMGLEPGHLYCSALDTTQAGLALGLAYLQSPIKVRGFCPVEKQFDRCREMADMANQGARRLGLDFTMAAKDFDNDFVGPRYGLPSPEGLEALRLLARTEGILLDPVYTSKAMAGLFADIEAGKLGGDKPVVFWHTGGHPALFAYADEVLG
ncbi:MAG: pyridoxal-phosphate dependent enzyme [Candidatus Latescibacteria bacterium]|nr:pyridoxal-phosphate dependent enzyme [Candidatus Latescibacterota bacterium]